MTGVCHIFPAKKSTNNRVDNSHLTGLQIVTPIKNSPGGGGKDTNENLKGKKEENGLTFAASVLTWGSTPALPPGPCFHRDRPLPAAHGGCRSRSSLPLSLRK